MTQPWQRGVCATTTTTTTTVPNSSDIHPSIHPSSSKKRREEEEEGEEGNSPEFSLPPIERPAGRPRRRDRPCSYETCGKQFHPHRKAQKYCSKSCAQKAGWTSSNPGKRSDFIRKFEISKEELAYRMNVLGQDAGTIGELFHKSPATVFRKAKRFGLRPSEIRREFRPVWVPKDKVVIVLKADMEKGADLEVITKAILREQHLDTRTSLEILPPQLMAVASSS